MDFKDLISQINDVEVDIYAKDKFELFQKISQYLASKVNVDSNLIYDLLRERELLGSTAIGNGFALPHLKLKGISVVFVVLSPSEKPSLQLKTLTLLAKMLKNFDVDSFLNKNSQEIKNYLNTFEKNE